MWLSRLHDSIQVAFDWYDYQTHLFTVGESLFGNPAKRENGTILDDRDVMLSDLNFEQNERFTYAYHFDEGWQVDIQVEKLVPLKRAATRFPRCVDGARAGPPEDCGGWEAYHDMLARIKEPSTDLGREWIEWLGPNYDPEAAGLQRINRALRKLDTAT
jgi:hypothetical protein